jgi:hypothetical protein
MPRDSAHAPPLPLFVHDTVSYPDAFARYEAIRPVLTGERSLRQQSHQTGINDWRLWRDLRRVRRDGLLGLLDAEPTASGAANSAIRSRAQEKPTRFDWQSGQWGTREGTEPVPL